MAQVNPSLENQLYIAVVEYVVSIGSTSWRVIEGEGAMAPFNF